jgi:hypothetical protein
VALDESQLDKLKAYCESVSSVVVGAITYLVLKALRLPPGASLPVVDAMLRLGDSGDSYATRLYLSKQVAGASKIALNWNVNDQRILEQNWFAYSWKAAADLPPEEILLEHLKALR